MADVELTQLSERLKKLEDTITKIKGNTGGILSGSDIRQQVLTGEDEDAYLKYFEKRQWREMSDWWEKKTQCRDGWKKKFVITEYNDVNVTPFSYDLSLGKQVFSIQKPNKNPEPLEEGKPYSLDPGETIVVITNEKVAIPHAYSATVWPRFSMVRQGVFQSMVKIDPTWHGKLAVAMSNLSPGTVQLKYGDAFATLLFYELSEESDVDLWKLSDLQGLAGIDVEMPIPEEFKNEMDRIANYIFDSGMRGYCRVTQQSLVVRGVKREHVDKLRKCFVANKKWDDYVDSLAKAWTTKKFGSVGYEKRMIVMNALGMEDLWAIVQGLSDEGYLNKEIVEELALDDDSLIEAAIRYGKPFDRFAKIPDAITRRIENETIPKIEAEIQSKIQTRVIILVFSLFGFISLVLTIFVMLWRVGGRDFLKTFSNWQGLWATIQIGGAIFGLGFLSIAFIWLRSVNSGLGRSRKKLKQQRKEIRKKDDDLKRAEEELEQKGNLLNVGLKKWRQKQAASVKKFRKYINNRYREFTKSKKAE